MLILHERSGPRSVSELSQRQRLTTAGILLELTLDSDSDMGPFDTDISADCFFFLPAESDSESCGSERATVYCAKIYHCLLSRKRKTLAI